MKQALGPLLLVLMTASLVPNVGRAGEWGIGIGIAAHQPPQQGADIEIDGGPFPFYEGDRLSLSFGSVSYRLIDLKGFQLALEGQARFDGFDPKDNSALAGMQKRNPALDAGFSLATSGRWGAAQLRFLGDVTGTHQGYEIAASYQVPYQSGRWTVVPSIELKWRSADLVDYYYGVRVSEANATRPAYAAGRATNISAGLTAAYKLTQRWQILAGAEYLRLDDSIKSSPIIEKNHEASIFSALIYRF